MTPLSTGDPESIGGYTLLGQLGAGGMGVVYLGVAASGRQVAVKLVHGPYAQEEEFRTRFRQEIEAARRVSGAFTAPVVDADPDADQPWMATLYVPGLNLAEVVQKDGPLSQRELRALGLGLTEALRDIQRAGLVHRDLKPGNVLMTEDGPRVIDFGISRASDHQSLTTTGRMIGTPPFMSPEQLAAPRDVTPASDVFSLGSLLVFAAVGTGPFDADSPYITGYQVVFGTPDLGGVPEALLNIVERCLDKDPAARPELTDIHRMLQALPESDATGSPRTGRSAEPRRRPAPRSAATTSAGAATGIGARQATPGPDAAHRPRCGAGRHGAGCRGGCLRVRFGHRHRHHHGHRPGHRPGRLAAPRLASVADETAVRREGCPSRLRQPWMRDGGSALFCGGTGFTAARIDAASGRTLWRAAPALRGRSRSAFATGWSTCTRNRTTGPGAWWPSTPVPGTGGGNATSTRPRRRSCTTADC
ncbi:serine/threonine-protein kinase [Streptomyces kaempferi]